MKKTANRRQKTAQKKRMLTTHDIRKEFPELVARIERLSDELGKVIRDRDSGYGGTYNRVYSFERETRAWDTLRLLAEESRNIVSWLVVE